MKTPASNHIHTHTCASVIPCIFSPLVQSANRGREQVDIPTTQLTSWPGIWAQCRSAWQTRPRFPDAPRQSKPSMHRLPEQPGFWLRPLLQCRSRSERCSVKKNVKWPKHQTSTPVKANVKTIPGGVLVCTRYLMKTRVLHVVRRSLFLSFYLHANLKANGARHRWLVGSLFCGQEEHIVDRFDIEQNIYVRPAPIILCALLTSWVNKNKNCGSADAPVAPRPDFGVPMLIRKEVLMNIQAHPSYSDLHLREEE